MRRRWTGAVPWLAAAALLAGAGCSSGGGGRTATPGPAPTTVPGPAAASGGSPATGGGRTPTPVPRSNGPALPAEDQVLSLPSAPQPVHPGQTATVSFQTRPGRSCQLEVRYPGVDDPQRLDPATADSSGQVAWSWTVNPDTGSGQANGTIVCSGGEQGEARIVVS